MMVVRANFLVMLIVFLPLHVTAAYIFPDPNNGPRYHASQSQYQIEYGTQRGQIAPTYKSYEFNQENRINDGSNRN